MAEVVARNPRAVAWFQHGEKWGWTEHISLPNAGLPQEEYAALARLWAQQRAQLLAPPCKLGRCVVSLRDTYRDALVVPVPAPFDTPLGPCYNADTLADGEMIEPQSAVVLQSNSKGGLYAYPHHLGGTARAYRRVGADRYGEPFVPSLTWQAAWARYRALLTGDPDYLGFPRGNYGFKVALKWPEAPRHVRITNITWEDNFLIVTAPGVGLADGDMVYLSRIKAVGPPTTGVYPATLLAADVFAVELKASSFQWQENGWARVYRYRGLPYEDVRLGPYAYLHRRGQYLPWTWVVIDGPDVPINPCGMIMAWGRGKPYRTTFRFFRDSLVTNTVQWQLADCAALDFPLYHAFGPGVYMDRPSGPWAGVGEQDVPHERTHGWPRSRLPGQCFVGEAEQWAQGCLTTDPPPAALPLCCREPTTIGVAGLVVGGNAIITHLTPVVEVAFKFSGGRVTRRGMATQPLTSGSANAVTFGSPVPDTVSWDTGGYFNPAHNDRLTAPADGYYVAAGGVNWPFGDSDGGEFVAYLSNPARGKIIASDSLNVKFGLIGGIMSQYDRFTSISSMVAMKAGEYIQFNLLHNFSQTPLLTGDENCWLSLTLAPAGLVSGLDGGTALAHGATLQFYRGAIASAETLVDGEPFFDVNTKTLYVGYQGTNYPVSGAPGPAGPADPTNNLATINKDSAALVAGQVVAAHPSGTGVQKAHAAPGYEAVGLAKAPAAANAGVTVQLEGQFQLADWSAITGTTTLAARATYFLSPTSGQLTTTLPSGAGQIAQIVGVAVAPDTLDLRIGDSILL